MYDHCTIGQLYVNGEYFCFTLEDKVREVSGQPVDKWKVPEETAIPQGRYPVQLQVSPRFGPDTLSILNVPGFAGIRMHAGNTAEDTEGCPLLGYSLTEDGKMIRPGTTRTAVADLKGKLRGAFKVGEKCFISIFNTPVRTPGLTGVLTTNGTRP